MRNDSVTDDAAQRGAITRPLDAAAALHALARHLDTLEPLLPAAPPDTQRVLRALLATRQTVRRPELRIVFVGTFKSGKSTLLNALLGAEVLPTRVLRATGITTVLTYAPAPCARVTRRRCDGSTFTTPLDFDERAATILLDLDLELEDKQAAEPDEPIETVTLGLPLDLLRQGCTLVDTPGLLDEASLSERSYRELARADLAVVVLSAYQLLAQHERDLLRYVHRLLDGQVICVVNQLDLVDASERAAVLERARTVLQGVGGPPLSCSDTPLIFATAALLAGEQRYQGVPAPAAPDERALLAAADSPDEPIEAIALAGLVRFEAWLGALVGSSQTSTVQLRARRSIVRHALERASSQVNTRHTAAQQATQQARARAHDVYAEQADARQQAIAADRARLARLALRLDSLGAHMVDDTVQRVTWRMQHDPDWPHNLAACLREALDAYAAQVSAGAQAALVATGFVVPPLDLRRGQLRRELANAENWIGGLGFWVGLLPGLHAPLPELPPELSGTLPPAISTTLATVGAFVDNLVGQTRLSTQHELLSAIYATSHSLLPALYAAAHAYLHSIDTRLQAAVWLPPAALPEVAALAAAWQHEARYRQLACWCRAAQAVLARNVLDVTE